MLKQKKIFYILLYSIILASFSFEKTYSKQLKEQPMVIIIPSYNNMKWVEKNLSMLAAQNETYSNWRAIYINDCSTDSTGQTVKDFIASHKLGDKIVLIENPKNMGAMYNWYHAIHSCQDNEIVVSLDGDDWFIDNQVLKYLNSIYQDKKTWVTYGQYVMYPSGQIGCCEQIPSYVIKQNSFRSYKWVSSHLRTFYAGLFKKINKKDFILNGDFLTTTCDQAIMLPLLEMAGEHAKFIDKVLYVYNYNNPISDFRKDSDLQQYVKNNIRSREKYKKLISLSE